jgi:hypothetical protein
MATDLTINAGKGIKITSGNGGFYIRNGNLKNFSWDGTAFYFNRQKGTDDKYDYRLQYDQITTYGGEGVPSYSHLLADLLAELDAEF